MTSNQSYLFGVKEKLDLKFNLIAEEHKNGKWQYNIQVQINPGNGMGKGPSKKVAEQNAAKETFELLGEI